MNFGTIHPIPTWLSPEERKLYNKQKNPLLKYLQQNTIPLDPFLATKIHLYLKNYILLHRAELALLPPSSPCLGDSVVDPSPLTPAHLEILAKNNERLRKNFNELHAFIQEYIKAKLAQGPQNFLDFYAQLLKDDAELDKKEAEEAAKLKEEQEKEIKALAATSPLGAPMSPSAPSPSSPPPSSPSDPSSPSTPSSPSLHPENPVNPVKNSSPPPFPIPKPAITAPKSPSPKPNAPPPNINNSPASSWAVLYTHPFPTKKK